MDNNTPGYNKLQWSVFVKNGRDQQYVVRADTEEEFKALKKFVLAEIGEESIAPKPVTQEKSVEQVREPVSEAISKPCPVHQLTMYQKMSKTGTLYFSHKGVVNGVEMTCFGGGYKPPRA